MNSIRSRCSPFAWRRASYFVQQRTTCLLRPYIGDVYLGILSWITLGLIAGFIGSKIVDREGQGFWLNIAFGIAGAVVGGFLFELFGQQALQV